MGSGFSEEGLQTPPRYSLDYKRVMRRRIIKSAKGQSPKP